jgi:DnaJ-domain-containing protein 1
MTAQDIQSLKELILETNQNHLNETCKHFDELTAQFASIEEPIKQIASLADKFAQLEERATRAEHQLAIAQSTLEAKEREVLFLKSLLMESDKQHHLQTEPQEHTMVAPGTLQGGSTGQALTAATTSNHLRATVDSLEKEGKSST